MSHTNSSTAPKNTRVIRTFIICIGIILLSLIFTKIIYSTEPKPKREAATKRTAMLVDTKPVSVGDYKTYIDALGVVRSAHHLDLKAQVSGVVQTINADPGQRVQAGDTLVKIDPRDYELALQQSQSAYQQALADYQIEQGEQSVAQRDYQRLQQNLNPLQKSLVLREPQLSAAKAEVQAKEAVLEKAKLDLLRTEISAPFDAQILQKNVTVGSHITPSQTLLVLTGTEEFWVEATIPMSQLAWLDTSTDAPSVEITSQTLNASPAITGTIKSVVGELEVQTRMVRVLISVKDPLGLTNNNVPPLILEDVVRCRLPTKTLKNTVRIERKYLRKNNTVWVMKDERLNIRSVKVAYSDQDYAFIQEGLSDGELLVLSDLSRVKEGAELRKKPSQSEGETP